MLQQILMEFSVSWIKKKLIVFPSSFYELNHKKSGRSFYDTQGNAFLPLFYYP